MTTRIAVDKAQAYAEALFRAAGLTEEAAKECADVFLLQEKRGIATHGFRRIKSMLDGLLDGSINKNPEIKVLREDAGTVLLDADRAMGMRGCNEAMGRAVAKSKEVGIGIAIVNNASHFLAAAPYCLYAAEQGDIGIATSNTGAAMSYPGTNTGSMSNSPFGFAVPTGAGFPIVYDSAMTISGGKLMQWALEGTAIPEGFAAVDADGNPTSDPKKVHSGGAPLPIGLHKGAGLAIMVEVLTGVLSGDGFLHFDAPDEHPDWIRDTYSQTCIAIDIERFIPRADFEARMAAYVAALKARPLAPGTDEILLPGERAARHTVDVLENGVYVTDEVMGHLTACSNTLGVPLPV